MATDDYSSPSKPARPGPMTDGDLKAVLYAKIQNSIGYQGGRLAANRMQALRYYQGDKFGNEVPGRSQVVSRDVQEAVDSMLPSLMKIFTSGDEIGRFDPTHKSAQSGLPQDIAAALKQAEEQAHQATDYVNWIFMVQNPGFHILYTWFKSALLFKNGIIKAWWNDAISFKQETYKGLTDTELAQLLSDDDIELIEDESYPDPNPMAASGVMPLQAPAGAAAPPPGAPPPQMQPQMGAMQGPQPPAGFSSPFGASLPLPQQALGQATLGQPAPPPMLHDVVARFTNRDGHVQIVPVPEDEFLIDRRAIGLDETPFCAHHYKTTITDLIGMYPEKADEIRNLPTGEEAEYTMERLERFKDEDELPWRQDNPADNSMREVWVTECYLRVDYDGDGIAEMRQVVVAGDTGYVILDNVTIDDHPFSAITPIIMPHKFFGQSIADQTMDIQLIKSTVVRQTMDHGYNALFPQMGVVEDQVNLDDLLTRRPGGIVRMKNANAIVPIPNPSWGVDPFALIQYWDSVREQRTGVQRFTAGPGANALNRNAYTDTATGVNAVENSSQERQELIARTFAETGVRRAFKRILELVCKHQQKKKIIRLRGKWVEMDPREWSTEMDVSISVGLGTGSRQQQLAAINQMLQYDTQIIQFQQGLNGPLVTAENFYNKLAKFVEYSGFKGVEPYYTDPSKAQMPQKPPQIPPDVQTEQIRAQAAMQRTQAELQHKAQIEGARLALDKELGYQKLSIEAQKLGIENKAVEYDAAIKTAQTQSDHAIRQQETDIKRAMQGRQGGTQP